MVYALDRNKKGSEMLREGELMSLSISSVYLASLWISDWGWCSSFFIGKNTRQERSDCPKFYC